MFIYLQGSFQAPPAFGAAVSFEEAPDHSEIQNLMNMNSKSCPEHWAFHGLSFRRLE